MRNFRKEISNKKYRVSTAFKEEVLSLPVEERTLYANHMNDYTKLLTYLINMDVKIEEEYKVLILQNSLPDEEYETFVLILINGKQSLNYNDVSTTLVNYEVRRKDKAFLKLLFRIPRFSINRKGKRSFIIASTTVTSGLRVIVLR